MPRHKYATDEERMAAIREYRKNYGAANRQLLNDRSRQWRADKKAAAAPAPIPVDPAQ